MYFVQRVQRTILLPAIALTLCLIPVGKVALAAEQIDQSNLPEWAGGWTHVNPTGEGQAVMWQTFTPGRSNLTAVEIDVLTANPGQGDDVLTVEIAKDGAVLASAECSVEDGFDGLLRFDFPQAVPLVPEQICELRVRDTGKTRFGWKYGSNTYERGSRHVFAQQRPGTDWFFQTYARVEPAAAKYSGGTGELNDPYQIATAADLIALGETPDDYDKHFLLTADIDLDPNLPGRKVFDRAVIAPDTNDVAGAFQRTSFTGVFEGNGHKISHLTITGEDYLGLFGQLGSWDARACEVRNLGLPDVAVTGSGSYTGALAGHNEGRVIRCHSTGAVSGTESVGGLVGYNWGSITTSYSSGRISASGGHTPLWLTTGVGGLVGSNAGTVTECYADASVTNTDEYGHTGGLIGGNRGSVNQCFSAGWVSGNDDVGGLVGTNIGEITNCYSVSTVSGDSYIGGLVGSNIHSGRAGYSRGFISHCYSIGVVGVISGTGSGVGGLLGYSEYSAIERSFWDVETSGQAGSDAGTGKTTAEMQTAGTFLDAGWDFVGETINGTEDIWKIAEGLGYPRLAWEKYSGGTGEPNDPYQIATAADLIALGETPADYDKHFLLTADIDLDPNLPGRRIFERAVIAPDMDPNDEFPTWGGTPFTGSSFVGTFDGDGHRILHLTIKGIGHLGLFGDLASNAEVKNLAVLEVSITGSRDFVGGLVGVNDGADVVRCYGSGLVGGDWCVGGLVGRNCAGSITESHTTGMVSGTHWVGGLAGDSGGSVSDCYSMAVVSGIEGVGGLVGYGWGTTSRCYSTGLVSGGHDVGGLVGEAALAGVYIIGCFWDIQTSGQATSCGGTGLTTEKMQNADTFFAWGVCGGEGVWTINESADYPRLRWGNQPGKAISDAPLPRLLTGTGREDDPFLIHTPEQLYLIGLFPCEWDKHFKLMADIDLSEYDGKNGRLAFNIIGRSYDSPFTGVFDGNGHKISDLTITGIYDVGLFGILRSGAEVRNLGVVDVNITGIQDYVGGLVGENEGSVVRCYSTGTVCGSACVGGLVGYTVGTVEQSYSTCAVTRDQDADYAENGVGGLAGVNTGDIIHCYSTGMVTGSGWFVGGLLGSNCAGVILPPLCGSVTDCFWDSETSGQTESAGGIGKTTAEMQTASTFLDAGWDFAGETANGREDIWWILEGQDYPRLWWELEETGP